MAGYLNRVTLIGNLGDDPEVKALNNGTRVVNMSVATTEKWKDKDGEPHEKTQWHRIVIWNEGLGKVAEKYLKKGSKVFLSGQMERRKWQDKEGNDRYITEVVLSGFNCELILLGDPRGSERREDAPGDRHAVYPEGKERAGKTLVQQPPPAANTMDEIPF